MKGVRMLAETGFPPSSPPSAAAVTLHGMLLALAVASVVGLFLRARRPARPLDVFLWGGAALTAAVVGLVAATGSSHYRSILLGYMLFVWLIAGVGCVISIARLVRAGRAPAVLWVLSSLLALGLLIGLLLPSVPSAREAARRMSCSNNMKQLALALMNWHDERGRFPDSQVSADGDPAHSWRVALLPYMENQRLYQHYDVHQRWDDPANLPLSQRPLPALVCPSDPHHQDQRARYFTNYLMVTGPGTVFPEGRGISLEAIRDGKTNTVLLAEASGQNIVWTRPYDLDVARDPMTVNQAGKEPTHSPSMLSSYHPNGAMTVMADGSVRFISEDIDTEVLRAMTTASGGEFVERD